MKIKKLTAAVGLALGLSAAAVSAETVLRLGSVAPTASPWGAWITNVAAEVEKVSGGELKLQLMLDGQIGDEVTMTRQAMRGRLDMIYVSNDPLAVIMPEMELISIPYFFDSAEQGSCVQHEHLAPIFEPLMAESSLVPLTWMEVGHSVIMSREPVNAPEDLRGMKVRVANGIIKRDYMSNLGTTPSPLSVADMVPALQTGTIEGVSIPVVYGIAVGIPKLAPNITVSNQYRLVGSLAVSKRTWDGLSEQEQEWLMSVAPMGKQLTGAILGAEQALLGQVAEAGVNVIRLDAEQEAVWRASAEGAEARAVEAVGGRSAEILEQLNAAKAACGS